MDVHRIIILSDGVCGCKPWTLRLREGRTPRFFENMELRTRFGSKRIEVTSEWRRVNKGDVCDLYFFPNTW
jgi:hypothetical protein